MAPGALRDRFDLPPSASQAFPGPPFLPPVSVSLKLVSIAESDEFYFLYGEYPASARAICRIERLGVRVTIRDSRPANTSESVLTCAESRQIMMVQWFGFLSEINTRPVEFITSNGIIRIVLRKRRPTRPQ
jgi:hypothetical protein